MVTVTFWWRTSGVKRKGDPKGDMIRKGNGIEGEKFPRNAAFSNYLHYLALINAKAPKCSSKTTTLKENVLLFELPLPESGCCNTSKKITTGIQPRGSEMPQSSSIFLKDGTEGVKKFLVCSKIIWCVNWLFASMRNGCEWAESFFIYCTYSGLPNLQSTGTGIRRPDQWSETTESKKAVQTGCGLQVLARRQHSAGFCPFDICNWWQNYQSSHSRFVIWDVTNGYKRKQ